MKNITKIIIGIALVLIAIYAVLAFDIPYGDDNGDRGNNGGIIASDLIRVASPKANDTVASPAVITGEARGTWYFEATFPIDILAPDGTVLGRGYAEALSDWMTEDFVPFTASVQFDPAGRTNGIIRIMKDNPSGLPENDAHIDIPVMFSAGTSTPQ